MKIINWIHKNEGWQAGVEIYIEEQFINAKEKIGHSNYEKKTEVIMMLERLLNDIKKIKYMNYYSI